MLKAKSKVIPSLCLLVIILAGNTALAAAPALTEYPAGSGSTPFEITKGSGNSVWFTDPELSSIGFVAADGSVTEYKILGGAAQPEGITLGSEGNLWYVDGSTNAVGMFNQSTHTANEFTSGLSALSYPFGITSGPDGNIWFTEQDTGKIGVINVKTDAITEYTPTGSPSFNNITSGPDGNLWAADMGNNSLDKITTGGSITEYPLPDIGSMPYDVTTGPDGNIWFTQQKSSDPAIGKMTPSGQVTMYNIPATASGSADPFDIVTGPDGNLWFTDQGQNYNQGAVGVITTGGSITEYATPSGSSLPVGITDPAGTMWFTENGVSKIGKANFTYLAQTTDSTASSLTTTSSKTSEPGAPNTGLGTPERNVNFISTLAAIISLPIALTVLYLSLRKYTKKAEISSGK